MKKVLSFNSFLYICTAFFIPLSSSALTILKELTSLRSIMKHANWKLNVKDLKGSLKLQSKHTYFVVSTCFQAKRLSGKLTCTTAIK